VWGSAGFTGRYRLGPEASPIRIVILTDYQCVDCNKVEPDVEEILASRSDVSLSIKHYPMCAEASPGVPCNRFAKQTLHANACWAARAAEAAGILKGDDGFWKMHRWLFSRSGNFTNAELAAAVRGMGFDPDVFSEVMRGPETLRRVQADCEEGGALGLYFTPMVFINGVEFKGWQVPGALRRTVEEVAAKNPPALKPTADRPALAASKYIQDWQDQPVRVMPPDTRAWTTGDGTSGAGGRRVDVVLFGDYQEPYTAATDLAIRQQLKRWPSVRYTFRHFPIDPKINPTLPPNVRPEALHPMAGRAAQAAEAAGSLGGGEAYWKMHEWLMRNLSSFNDESLRAAARNLGLDPSELFAEMDKPHVAAAIVEDARAAQQLGLTGVPMVFVNAKWVWRTTREGENIVLKVIEEAAGL
jgi:protein-disulfide isomerase